MLDWFAQSLYFVMLLQIVITLVVVPILTFKHFSKIATDYMTKRVGEDGEVKQCFDKASKIYWTSVGFALAFTSVIVLSAFLNKQELFNWDNQMGLMILFLMSLFPVIVMVFMHRRLLTVFKQKAGGKRFASLSSSSWTSYISRPIFSFAIAANIVFTATVFYFAQNPFEGFAGYYNLIGQLILNVFFAFIIFVVYRDQKSVSFSYPEEKVNFKKRAMNINLLILALALLHISLTMWVQGSGLNEYKLVLQSFYLQIVLVLSAFTLRLPKSMFEQQDLVEQ